jgi:hypothetical protein
MSHPAARLRMLDPPVETRPVVRLKILDPLVETHPAVRLKIKAPLVMIRPVTNQMIKVNPAIHLAWIRMIKIRRRKTQRIKDQPSNDWEHRLLYVNPVNTRQKINSPSHNSRGASFFLSVGAYHLR